ncbi:MAG: ABC transporter ATP-binding protein [Pseudomonadota bacterium]
MPSLISANMPIIELRDVRKSYSGVSEQNVLKGIDLDVDGGEFCAIIGRSGSGKSTLLNLVGAMDNADGGRIRVAGMDLTALSEQQRCKVRRHHIGFVFQAYNLLPTLTIAENVELPLELINQRDRSRVPALLERLGLTDKARRFPGELSGGEQQRAAIARALVHQPAVVIADEPTGNLDLETGRQVVGLLENVIAETNTSLIMATHSLDVVGQADQVHALKDGTLES